MAVMVIHKEIGSVRVFHRSADYIFIFIGIIEPILLENRIPLKPKLGGGRGGGGVGWGAGLGTLRPRKLHWCILTLVMLNKLRYHTHI